MPPEAPKSGGLQIGGKLIARNTAINLAGRIAPLLVAVAAMPYVVHHLGPDQLGLLSLAWIVVGYFAVFDLGIGPATTKFVAEYLGRGETERLPELVWTAVISQASLGVVAGLVLAAVTPFLVDRLLKIPAPLHPQAHLVFLILAFSLPLTLAAGSLAGVLAASQRFDLINAVGVPSSALNYLLPVGALALGLGLPAIVLFLVIARAVALAASFLLCRKLYPALSARPRFRRELVGPILRFGGWVTVSGTISPALTYFDQLLIGSLISVAAVGFYTPAYTIAAKAGILLGSLSITLFPAFSLSAGRQDNDWTRKTLIQSLKFLTILGGLAAALLALLARPLLTLWLGARFAARGATPLQILAVGVLLNSLAAVAGSVSWAAGRTDLPAKFHIAELPVHVAVTWLLVTRLGLPGAALAWTLRAGLDFFLLTAAACRLTRTPARVLASRGLGPSIASIAGLALGLYAARESVHAAVAEAGLASLLGGTFLLVSWRYALNTEERCQIRTWLRTAR